MESKIEFKECPFCLDKYSIQLHSDGGCRHFKVHCHNCNCTKYPLNGDDSKEGAIKSWNRRVIIEE